MSAIGSGVFSDVTCQSLVDGKSVAVKKFKKDGDWKRQRESELTALIILRGHGVPNLIENTSDTITMEYLPKRLDKIIRGFISPVEFILRVAKSLLTTLSHAHIWDIIHTDIKPQNILLTDDYKVRLADWGSSVDSTEYDFTKENSQTHDSYCTLWYRAPELLLQLSKADYRADLWSVGCVLYEMYYSTPFAKCQDEYDCVEQIVMHLGKPKKNSVLYESPVGAFRELMLEGSESGLTVAKMSKIDTIGNLLLDLLKMDPNDRITADEALKKYF